MKTLVVGAVALAFLTGSAAFAQRYDARPSDRDARPGYGDRRGSDEQRGSWSEGDKIPYEYMKGGKYIAYNWGENGLPRPPRGYAWMEINDHFYLANQQSGLIRDVRDGRERRASLREGSQVPYDLMQGGKYIHYQWREAGLSAPPPGYAWMKIGAQYFLADQKSGLIREVRGADETRRRGTRSGY